MTTRTPSGTFQRTNSWKKPLDPGRDARLDRIEHVLERFPYRVFTFDEFGPLGIRPAAGARWAEQGHPGFLAGAAGCDRPVDLRFSIVHDRPWSRSAVHALSSHVADGHRQL